MVLMRKNGVCRYVPDACVPAFKADGFTVDGEESEATVKVAKAAPAEQKKEEAVKETRSEAFVCPHCGKEYAKEVNLVKHIAEKHAEG